MKKLKLASFLLGASLLIGACSPAPEATPQATVEFQTPPVMVTYYPVTGITTDAIFTSMATAGPKLSDGTRVEGRFSPIPTVSWKLSSGNRPHCSLKSLSINFASEIVLPKHTGGLTPDLAAKWALYAAGVAAHEQRHLDIYLEAAQSLKIALLAVPAQEFDRDCAKLDAALSSVLAAERVAHDAKQAQFHTEADAQRAAILTPLTMLYARLGGLLDEINVINLRMTGLAQSGRWPEHNALVPPQNRMVAEYNALRDEYSALREVVRWTP